MRGASGKCVDEYMATVPPGSSGPFNSRSPETETVLQLKDRHCGSEAW